MSKRLGLHLASQPFDVHTGYKSPELTAAIDFVLTELVAERRKQGGRIRDLPSLRTHVTALIVDMYAAWQNYPFVYRGLARARNAYFGENSRYRKLHFSYDHMMGALDALIALGYAKQRLGWHNRERGIGKQTRIRARRKLIHLLKGFGVRPPTDDIPFEELIELRTSEKQPINFVWTDETLEMAERLVKINKQLSKRRIALHVPDRELVNMNKQLGREGEQPIDFTRVQLRRVFHNGTFEHGGRFYGGWWQNVPQGYRRHITIDFKETVELDYSGMHLRMLYALENAHIPEDPYVLVKGVSREDQKQAILVMINAETELSAVRSIRRKGIKNAKKLVNALREVHTPIAKHFNTGAGLWLMRFDSDIAETVMLEMHKLGGIALPVHDSFIVRMGREDELQAAMEMAFEQRFPGTPTKLEAKPTFRTEEEGKEASEPRVFGSDWNIAKYLREHAIYYRVTGNAVRRS